MISNFYPPPHNFSSGNSYNYITSGTWQYYQNRGQYGLNDNCKSFNESFLLLEKIRFKKILFDIYILG